MARRFNNYYLLVIFAVLIGLFFVLQKTKVKKSERTFDKASISLDTARVDQILLYLKAEDHEEIRLFQKDGVWKVQKGDIIANAQPYRAEGIITELSNLKILRLAAKDKSKWEEYQVTDSLGTRVKVLDQSGNTALDLMIGKLSFLQNPGQQGGFSGGNNAKGISYVRPAGQNEVYGVDGYLPMTFNQNFNNWRDGTFLKCNAEDITKVTVDFPADSGYVLNRVDSIWYADGISVDDAKVSSYLGALSNKNNNSFDDAFTPGSAPEFKLIIEGNNMNAIVVQGYWDAADSFILHSSQNPDTYVVSTANGLFKDLFRSKSSFMKTMEG